MFQIFINIQNWVGKREKDPNVFSYHKIMQSNTAQLHKDFDCYIFPNTYNNKCPFPEFNITVPRRVFQELSKNSKYMSRYLDMVKKVVEVYNWDIDTESSSRQSSSQNGTRLAIILDSLFNFRELQTVKTPFYEVIKKRITKYLCSLNRFAVKNKGLLDSTNKKNMIFSKIIRALFGFNRTNVYMPRNTKYIPSEVCGPLDGRT